MLYNSKPFLGVILKIYVISLPKSLERQQFVKSQLDSHNMPFEFISAIYGKDLTETEKEKLYDCKKAKFFSGELTPGELGCALSHRSIYEKMIKEGTERAIILEDDVTLRPDFFDLLQPLSELPIKKYIIKLERCYWSIKNENNVKYGHFTPWRRIKLCGEYFIGQPLANPTLTWGYYIDLPAAQALYSIMPRVFLVADSWWYYRKFISLRMINKPVISNNDEIFGSIIGERDSTQITPETKITFSEKIYSLIKKIIKLFKWIFY